MQKIISIYAFALIFVLVIACEFDIFNPFQKTSFNGETSPVKTTTPTETPTAVPTAPPDSTKDITSFSFMDADNIALTADVIAVIVGTDISAIVPYETVVTALIPTITINDASVSPLSGVTQDFTIPVVYTVTADDSSEQIYTVTVFIASTVSFSNVRTNSQLESGFIIGTAAGGTGTITAVEVSYDGGGYATASGATSWKMEIPAGTSTWKKGSQHTVEVRSKDDDEIYSAVASVNVRKTTNKDVNGDGYADIGVGASDEEAGSIGNAYIFYSSSDGLSSTPDTTITGEAAGICLGSVRIIMTTRIMRGKSISSTALPLMVSVSAQYKIPRRMQVLSAVQTNI